MAGTSYLKAIAQPQTAGLPSLRPSRRWPVRPSDDSLETVLEAQPMRPGRGIASPSRAATSESDFEPSFDIPGAVPHTEGRDSNRAIAQQASVPEFSSTLTQGDVARSDELRPRLEASRGTPDSSPRDAIRSPVLVDSGMRDAATSSFNVNHRASDVTNKPVMPRSIGPNPLDETIGGAASAMQPQPGSISKHEGSSIPLRPSAARATQSEELRPHRAQPSTGERYREIQRERVATAESRAPQIHIGSIEVRVTQPPAPSPIPRRLATPVPLTQARAPLSRGFNSPFGLRQG